MITVDNLKNVSLYTINKRGQVSFNEELDTTQINDTIITTYLINAINTTYNNRRELEFNYIINNSENEIPIDEENQTEENSITNEDEFVLDNDHPIVSKIKDILNSPDDTDLFKSKTRSIASILFSHTPSNAKKGDLVSCLFKLTNKYYLVFLKIDENKILNQGENGLWTVNSGLDIEAKLQKAAYIEIPIIDDTYQTNYLEWKLNAIDNISNDSQYWNIDFLGAHYKSDSKINSERFAKFFKDFIETVSNPQKKNDLTFSYRSYLKTNENFSIEDFENSVFGTSADFRSEKIRFRESIVEASQNTETGFDLVFSFHTPTIKKEYEKQGSFVFDGMLKIIPTRTTGNQGSDENILRENIAFIDENTNEDFNDTRGKYAKIYYDDYSYDFK